MALISFNANNVDPQQEFQPVPAGWYNLMIVESEMKDNANGRGLSLQIKIIDGQYANRVVFDYLNVQHPNAVAQEIAEKKLSAYCHATGVLVLQDSQQLHGIPFSGKLGIKVDKSGQYEPSNDVRAVKALSEGGSAPAGNAPPAGFAPAAPPAGFQPKVAQPRPAAAQPAPAQVQAAPAPSPAPAAPAAGSSPPWAKRK